MKMQEFLSKFRSTIDDHLHNTYPSINIDNIDDEEREQWVMNDETLYNLALANNVEEM